MNILCLNTAFPTANIALEFNGKSFFNEINSNCKHSENLLVEVEKLLSLACPNANTSKTLGQIDVVAVVVGPGSFTGLRIAISSAKAILCVNPNMKTVAIGSLEFIAAQSKNEKKTAILDALSGLAFVQEFEENKTSKPKMVEIEQAKLMQNLVSIENFNFETQKVSLCSESLLDFAKQKIANNEFVCENELVPLYIRPSQAEANLDRNKK